MMLEIQVNRQSVSLSVIDVEELESNWGQVRYIVLRGEDANGIYNNVGEIDYLWYRWCKFNGERDS